MSAIDLHAHLAPRAPLERHGWLAEDGDVIRVRVGDTWQTVTRSLVDPGDLLADADAAGLATRVVSLPPFLLRHDLPAADGAAYSRAMNDGLAALAGASVGRIRMLATVPLQDPAAAAEELRRACTDLGALGVIIATNVAGRIGLDDPGLEPFWQAADALGALVFIHPHDVAGAARMKRYHLRNLVGNPLETALAGAALIFGGVLARHARLEVLLSHGGGALPWILGRLDHGFEVRPECQGIVGTPSSWARRFLYDTVVFAPDILKTLVAWMGADRIVLGTDYPFDMSDRRPLITVAAAIGDADQRRAVIEGNARRSAFSVERGGRTMAVTGVAEDIYPKFSAQEYQRRHRLFRDLLAARRLDGAIVYGGYKELYQANARWLTGMRESMQFYAFFPATGEPTAWNALYPHLHAARRMSALADTRWGGASIGHAVAERIKEQGLQRGRIGMVGVHSRRGITLPMDHYLIWKDELPQAEFVNITRDVEQLAQVKSDEELSFYRRGAGYTDYAMAELIKATRPGITEVALYGRIFSAAYECGGDSLDVVLIGSTSMRDADMPYPRHIPSQRVVQAGDVVLNEISVGYGGCSGQLIVPISVGQPTAEYRELYRIARQALDSVARVLRPGATQDDILEAARPITDAGLVAEAPIIHGWPNPPMFPILPVGKPAETYSPEPFVLQASQLIMVEPNPTTPDLRRGVFLGALYVVTPGGGRCLQDHPLDFAVV